MGAARAAALAGGATPGSGKPGGEALHGLPFAGLALEAWLPAPPTAAWPFVTDPESINRWSTAGMQRPERGDGGGFGKAKAPRQVALPRPLPMISEAIQRADAPSRLTYRVVASPAVRYHRGGLPVSVDGAGTRLRCEVDMALLLRGAAASALADAHAIAHASGVCATGYG